MMITQIGAILLFVSIGIASGSYSRHALKTFPYVNSLKNSLHARTFSTTPLLRGNASGHQAKKQKQPTAVQLAEHKKYNVLYNAIINQMTPKENPLTERGYKDTTNTKILEDFFKGDVPMHVGRYTDVNEAEAAKSVYFGNSAAERAQLRVSSDEHKEFLIKGLSIQAAEDFGPQLEKDLTSKFGHAFKVEVTHQNEAGIAYLHRRMPIVELSWLYHNFGHFETGYWQAGNIFDCMGKDGRTMVRAVVEGLEAYMGDDYPGIMANVHMGATNQEVGQIEWLAMRQHNPSSLNIDIQYPMGPH